MEATLLGSLKPSFPQLMRHESRPRLHLGPPFITCKLRGGPRKPLWRKKRLSTEAIQAIQSLKLAKSSPARLEDVFKGKLSRLLKTDLIDTLELLQKQDELDLALKVFEFVKKEPWYKPDLLLYNPMIQMLGRHELIEMAEELFTRLQTEELKPDSRAFTEMIGAYLRVDKIDKAMEMYGRMKASGCAPDKLTFTILIRNLEKAGHQELADSIKNECGEYIDKAREFLEEVKQKRTRKTSLNVV